MARFILRFLNGLITFAVIFILSISVAYAVYSLWDNQQVYDAVENTMDEMREIRNQIDAPKTKKGIDALIASMATAAKEPEPTPAAAETPAAVTEAAANLTETPEAVTTGKPAETAEEKAGAAATAVSSETAKAQTEVPAEHSAPAETATKAPTATPKATLTATPTEEPADDSPFGKLKAINPDITAWITMPGTAIDYPVLQGSSNYSYINKDVYGEFALAGSIFLDYRNDSGYQDIYSLLYGHDMAKHRMFSDLNLYKEEEFFTENYLGILLTPEGNHLLKTIACVVTPEGNSGLFNPQNWNYFTPEQILKTVQEDAVQINEEGLNALKERLDKGEQLNVVALSTCSGEYTDARTILLTLMDP